MLSWVNYISKQLLEFFSNRLRFSSPMNLNFAFFTTEPVSVVSETIAKNTCKMVSETIRDERETVGDIPDGKGAGPRHLSPMVKIVKN